MEKKIQIELTRWELANVITGLHTAIKTKMRGARRTAKARAARGAPSTGIAGRAMECVDLRILAERLTATFMEDKQREQQAEQTQPPAPSTEG
jgi:hypothetical protein